MSTTSATFIPASWAGLLGIERYVGQKVFDGAGDGNGERDIAGLRVAAIGNGADVVKIVPELVAAAALVKVFLSDPCWVLPRLRVTVPPRISSMLVRVPGVGPTVAHAQDRVHGVVPPAGEPDHWIAAAVDLGARLSLRLRVRDRWTRRQLTPDHLRRGTPMVFSNDFYSALQRDNCELITWPIATLSPVGIRTADGLEHHVDTIVFADHQPSFLNEGNHR